jgi:CheY-like chemotaxis protein
LTSNRSILLVEDNPSDIALAKRALEKGRIVNDLVVAEDGQEAIDYLLSSQSDRPPAEPPALILLDLKLPKVPGFEVLRRLRTNAATRRLPVVILTSSKQEEDIADSYDLGANSYVRKPVDFQQFAQAIEQLGLYWLILNEPPPKVK